MIMRAKSKHCDQEDCNIIDFLTPGVRHHVAAIDVTNTKKWAPFCHLPALSDRARVPSTAFVFSTRHFSPPRLRQSFTNRLSTKCMQEKPDLKYANIITEVLKACRQHH